MISTLVDRLVATTRELARAFRELDAAEDATLAGTLERLRKRKGFPDFDQVQWLRIKAVLASVWSRELRVERRPDVLALACELLASPDVPYTVGVLRFIAAVVLRGLYDISYTTTYLDALRAAYDDELRPRLARSGRRVSRKRPSPAAQFLVDLACLDGSLWRAYSDQERSAYYASFERAVFGIEPESRHPSFAPLKGRLPDFSHLLELGFGQPTCITGLDEITHGLLPSVRPDDPWVGEGSLVTLIAGPPGSGKTSIALTLASRMAELGSQVTYLGTEEETYALRAKRASIANPHTLAEALLGAGEGASPSPLHFIDGGAIASFAELVERLEAEFAVVRRELPAKRQRGLYLVFPRVIVIDSLTALRHRALGQAPGRHELSQLLASLRRLGLCVFLVGGPQDAEDEGLAYLVDNVLSLGLRELPEGGHLARSILVEKTRLQTSDRGRHVFRLSRFEGCTVSPSLPSVLYRLHGAGVPEPERFERAVLAPVLALRGRAHVLVYGTGSSGKACLGIAALLEPRRHSYFDADWKQYLERHPTHAVDDADRAWAARARVLVVSFLRDRNFYAELVGSVSQHRFAGGLDPQRLEVIDFYPGFVDGETVIARVRHALARARLEGRPFSGVLIDGIHNVAMQFPLLEREPLLWPTLFRILRAEGVDAVSTFTAFDVQDAFFRLLQGSCDYTLVVEPATGRAKGRGLVQVRVVSSLDGLDQQGVSFLWDPRVLRSVAAPGEPAPSP